MGAGAGGPNRRAGVSERPDKVNAEAGCPRGETCWGRGSVKPCAKQDFSARMNERKDRDPGISALRNRHI